MKVFAVHTHTHTHKRKHARILCTQVFVVFDGILEQSPHEVQCAVLAAGQQLATGAAPKAARSPAAAAQLEWLLQVCMVCGKMLKLNWCRHKVLWWRSCVVPARKNKRKNYTGFGNHTPHN